MFRCHGIGGAAVLTGILVGSLAIGCIPAKKAETVDHTEANELKGTHLARYLDIIDELSSMMEADSREQATRQLETIRAWVDKNKADASKTLNGLNQDVLAMSEEEREHWRDVARPELEKKMDDFARVQLAFQKHLTEIQKWELGEILSQLK